MSRQRKRAPQWPLPEGDVADDMAVAASFAQFPSSSYQATQSTDSKNIEDDAETQQEQEPSEVEEQQQAGKEESESDESDEDDPNEIQDLVKSDKDEPDTESDDDDDESEVDLTDALAHMNNDENPSKGQAPKTEHEIDPYATPIEELQSNFQLNLTVEEEERLRLAGAVENSSIHLSPAGQISCHMIQDRTIVVENTTNKGPLDEGSLLVVRVQSQEDNGKPQLLPLGKVFEIFGPISRPLYTIRLPPPPSQPKKKPKQKPQKMAPVAGDENEICLSDESQGEEEQNEPTPEEEQKTETPLPDDDWAPTGKFTKILASALRQTVYYLPDEAKLLDTFAIMRSSGKGCDASNLFDEEVMNTNEMYFSDDEEEREFKSKRKNKSGKANIREQTRHDDRKSNIPGFHAASAPSPYIPPPPPPPAFYPQHPPGPPQYNPYPPQQQGYPVQGMVHPYPVYQQQPTGQAYAYSAPLYGQYPPVPGSYQQQGQPPPCEEESDTVYFS